MINLERGKFNVVIGGQAGSEGKGKIACVIADEFLKSNPNGLVVTCNHMPNAGHTFRDGEYKYVAGQLPTPAIFNNEKYGYDVPVVIGPGSAINLNLLKKEIEQCELVPGETLFIHPNAGIVTKEHLDIEGECLDNVSSTKKGGGACLAAKVMRQGSCGVHAIARDLLPNYLRPALTDTSEFLILAMKNNLAVLYEGAQGFDLDINHGLDYPYTTSRMSNVSQALADSGIPPTMIGKRVMVIRPYPIRVGNAFDSNGNMIGTSGDYASDNEELDWDKIKELSNTPDDISLVERTTVTQKIRRVFTFSRERFEKSVRVNDPTEIVITFADHLDRELYGKRVNYNNLSYELKSKIGTFVDNNILSVYVNHKVPFVSTGPDHLDIINTYM